MNHYFKFLLPILRIFKIIFFFLIDSIRFIKYSNSILPNSSKKRIIANIIYLYHTVEKGIVMPNRRWNFGHSKIYDLIENCNCYIDRYGKDNDELHCAIGVLQTYLNEHSMNGISVPNVINMSIRALSRRVVNIEPVPQIKKSNEEYFSSTNSPFVDFAYSRASVRDYTEVTVPTDYIINAVDIAKSAPSACNRQATRVYIVQEREKIDKVLSYQNGNKGFGHLANKLLILTTEIASFRGAAERNFGWIDSGIFAMNLMYALHYLNIGSCCLNAGFSPFIEKKIRQLCEIPSEEVICLFIACGFVPDNIDLTKSTRKKTKELIRLR